MKSYDRYELLWHEFTWWEFTWCEFIWYCEFIYTMMLVLSPTILCWLHKKGFTINPLKCEWAVRETDWLGYWLTPQGLYLKKNINAILHMDQPCNATDLCMFIGCTNYYCDMSPRCRHILKPLTDQSGLTTYFMDKWNAKRICKMHLLMAARA